VRGRPAGDLPAGGGRLAVPLVGPRWAPVAPGDDAAVRARLAGSRVSIVGCGGLGSNSAMMLVRAGVRSLTLVDHDVVEESNLNRQMFFRDQLGMPKTQALAQTLRRIEPGLDLTLVQHRVTAGDLCGIVGDADVVVEAVDQADVKAMIANVLLRDRPGTPLVGASGLAGFDSANDISTECVADDFYLAGDQRSDVRKGLPLLAPRVMTAAAHQAHAVVRILLGHPEP
jgi:sulfur carrier protein ThiS adenylyltransferase